MRSRIPTALVLFALLGAGCSDEPSESAPSADTKTATTPSKAVRFSACMRKHGVAEFPDPDASGELTIDAVLNGSSLDPDGPAWKQALAACKDLQPSGFTGRKRTPTQQEDALAFAECIRDNGVKDFPDPTPGEPLVNTNKIPSAATERGMDVLNAAMQACGEQAERVLGRR